MAASEAAVVALARKCFVPVFAIAALFGGAIELVLFERLAVGIGRSQPCAVDPAALQNAADIDTNTAADPHDREWLPCDPPNSAIRRSGVGRFLDISADSVTLRRPRAAAVIRGPPARG